MTETEAEKHICPFALARGDFPCAGSKCMAWDWTEKMPLLSVKTEAVPEERYIKLELVQTSMFPKPNGKGWESVDEPQPPSSKQTSFWTQEWKRDESFAIAERNGDCSLKNGR